MLTYQVVTRPLSKPQHLAWRAWCPLWRMRIHPWSVRCRTLRCTIARCEEAVVPCAAEVRLQDRAWSKIFTTIKWCIHNRRKHQRLRRYLMTLVFPRCLKARMLDYRSTCFICLRGSHSCCHCCCKTWHCCWLLVRKKKRESDRLFSGKVLGGCLIYLWPMALICPIFASRHALNGLEGKTFCFRFSCLGISLSKVLLRCPVSQTWSFTRTYCAIYMS